MILELKLVRRQERESAPRFPARELLIKTTAITFC